MQSPKWLGVRWLAAVAHGLATILLTATLTSGQFRDLTPQQPSAEAERSDSDADGPAPDPQPALEPEALPDKPAATEELLPDAEADTADGDVAAEALRRISEQIEAELIDDTELRPLKFRGILVGETTYDQVLAEWGEPFKTVTSNEIQILKYRALPFRQVDLTIADKRVASVLIHLFDLQDPAHIAKELRMTQIEPVPVPDEFGNVMGLAFPERGVLLGFDLLDPESLVSKILLEPVNPEPFLLRAMYDFEHQYEKQFADIDRSLALNRHYSRALAHQAHLLAELGRFKDALDSIDRAIEQDRDNPAFLMLRARTLESLGRLTAAQRQLDKLLARDELPKHIEAESELLRGDLICQEQPGKFNQGMRHHLKAIELAAPLANSAEFEPRRSAKRTLIHAHLAVARDISLGNFQKQRSVVPKWIQRGEALVKEYVRRDQGDPALRILVAHQLFACAAHLRNPDDPGPLIDDVIEVGRQQIADSVDVANKHRLEWQLGCTLAEATRLQRVRGQFEEAIDVANDALALFQHSAPHRQSTPDQKYLVGRLYFHIGSLHAVQRKDHEEALGWYHKSEPMLSIAAPSPFLSDARTHGESFVSMGVSYWETRDQERAIELTEMGTDLLQKAVESEWLSDDALAIPYSNLAAMHKAAGHDTEAKAFAELAASLDSSTELR